MPYGEYTVVCHDIQIVIIQTTLHRAVSGAPEQTQLPGAVFSPLPSTSGFSRCDCVLGGGKEVMVGGKLVLAELMGVISRVLGKLAD